MSDERNTTEASYALRLQSALKAEAERTADLFRERAGTDEPPREGDEP